MWTLVFVFLVLLASPANFKDLNKSKKWNRQQQAYYSAPNHFPILARITPIDERSVPNSETFYAYIYPTMISPPFYPFYSVLCRKEIKPSQSTSLEIRDVKEEYLNPLNSESTTETKEMIETTTYQVESEESTTEDRLENATDPTISEDFSTSTNIESNIFQCEGVTCPDKAESCKITKNAIEPNYDEILQTVYCLSSSEEVLLESETKSINPSKGSSLNSSKTVNRNNFKNMDIKMREIREKAGENFKNVFGEFNKNMKKAFPSKRFN